MRDEDLGRAMPWLHYSAFRLERFAPRSEGSVLVSVGAHRRARDARVLASGFAEVHVFEPVYARELRNPRNFDGIEGGRKRLSDTFTHKNSGSQEHNHCFMHYFGVKTLSATLFSPPLMIPGDGARRCRRSRTCWRRLGGPCWRRTGPS